MVTLITGANGQLGQDFQRLFKERGLVFLATDLDLDITNIELLRNFVKKKQIELIINCAAYNAVLPASVSRANIMAVPTPIRVAFITHSPHKI